MKCSFIVSTGRTGTQSLAKVLNDVGGPKVVARHEPPPSRIFRVLSTMRAAGLLPDALALLCIKTLRRSLDRQEMDAVYVESNNFLFGLCDLLAGHFQNAQILHIVRDPRTYSESHLRHGVFKGFKGVVSLFFPFWLIKPKHLKIKTKRSWFGMSKHERLFWFWSLVNAVISNSCQNLGDRYRVVRFEDLFSNKDLFVDVLLWLGLPKEKIGEASSLISARYNVGRQPYDEVGARENKVLREICGEQARHYGYK